MALLLLDHHGGLVFLPGDSVFGRHGVFHRLGEVLRLAAGRRHAGSGRNLDFGRQGRDVGSERHVHRDRHLLVVDFGGLGLLRDREVEDVGFGALGRGSLHDLEGERVDRDAVARSCEAHVDRTGRFAAFVGLDGELQRIVLRFDLAPLFGGAVVRQFDLERYAAQGRTVGLLDGDRGRGIDAVIAYVERVGRETHACQRGRGGESHIGLDTVFAGVVVAARREGARREREGEAILEDTFHNAIVFKGFRMDVSVGRGLRAGRRACSWPGPSCP